MAQKVIVELIDDLDGEPIDAGGETISFAVNGVEYTIDLNDAPAQLQGCEGEDFAATRSCSASPSGP